MGVNTGKTVIMHLDLQVCLSNGKKPQPPPAGT